MKVRIVLCSIALLGLVWFLGTAVLAQEWSQEDHPQDKPLKLGFDMGYAPFHYWTETGQPAGFGIEVSLEVARRLGRPGIEIVDVNWSGIFAGLFAKQYEAIFFTLNITRERAEFLDYTEPFMNSGQMMICREEDANIITSPEALAGKTAGVNAGSVADKWCTENAGKYGFAVQRYDKVDDAVFALITRKVDAVVADLPTMSVFVQQKPGLAKAFIISPETDFGLGHAGFAFGFRVGDPYRFAVERVLEGMKLDGTLQRLIEKYFGPPAPNDYANIVFVGYGCPGIRGYEPTAYHKPYFPEK